jgi:hypothetical protein
MNACRKLWGGRIDGRTDKRTDGPPDRRTDRSSVRPSVRLFLGLCALASVCLFAAPDRVWAQDADPCAAPANLVVAENCRPGTDGWRIDDYATTVAGFASATSVAPGETLTFFVTADRPTFDLEIYRTGYYGGLGARLVLEQRGLAGQRQPSCWEQGETGLISCHTWSPSYTLTVPVDWVSGVYLAKFRRPGGGEYFTTFVVRDDARSAPLLVQIPTATYQAYNNWGGKSTYNYSSSACAVPASGQPRAVSVSFDRPYASTLDDANNYLRNDFLMVQWLEAQGYDLSYVDSLDVHGYGTPGARNRLTEAEAVLSIGHDEYWSQAMWDAFQAARDNGVDLGFFSANTAYWRVRFETGPTGGANRTLTTYKSVEGGRPDPVQSTSTFRDPVGPALPENQLLGALFTGDNDSLYFPIRVTAEMAQDRLYRHTGLQALPAGSAALLGREVIGWEWASVVDNGFTPEGLTILAESPVVGALLTDAGHYRNNRVGQTVSHITRYTAPSGAVVFQAGTVQWGWGLAGREPNPILRQMTYNVLADMGVRPATPAPTLILDGSPTEPAPVAPAVSGTSARISALRVAPTADGAVVTWRTDQPSIGQLFYGETPATINEPVLASEAAATTHTLTVTGLQPDREYSLLVVALTETGAISVSEPFALRTAAADIGPRLGAWAEATLLPIRCSARPYLRPVAGWMSEQPLLSGVLVSVAALAVVGGTGWWVWLRRRRNPRASQVGRRGRS